MVYKRKNWFNDKYLWIKYYDEDEDQWYHWKYTNKAKYLEEKAYKWYEFYGTSLKGNRFKNFAEVYGPEDIVDYIHTKHQLDDPANVNRRFCKRRLYQKGINTISEKIKNDEIIASIIMDIAFILQDERKDELYLELSDWIYQDPQEMRAGTIDAFTYNNRWNELSRLVKIKHKDRFWNDLVDPLYKLEKNYLYWIEYEKFWNDCISEGEAIWTSIINASTNTIISTPLYNKLKRHLKHTSSHFEGHYKTWMQALKKEPTPILPPTLSIEDRIALFKLHHASRHDDHPRIRSTISQKKMGITIQTHIRIKNYILYHFINILLIFIYYIFYISMDIFIYIKMVIYTVLYPWYIISLQKQQSPSILLLVYIIICMARRALGIGVDPGSCINFRTKIGNTLVLFNIYKHNIRMPVGYGSASDIHPHIQTIPAMLIVGNTILVSDRYIIIRTQ